MPAAIKTWWYPGERNGFELIYPKDQARRLAQGSRDELLTTKNETSRPEETNTAELSRISGSGEHSFDDNAGNAAGDPSGQVTRGEAMPPATSSAQNNDSANNANNMNNRSGNSVATSGMQTARNERSRLPATATAMPAVGVAGLLSLAAAFGLALYRRARVS
jgi:hypothetical protein